MHKMANNSGRCRLPVGAANVSLWAVCIIMFQLSVCVAVRADSGRNDKQATGDRSDEQATGMPSPLQLLGSRRYHFFESQLTTTRAQDGGATTHTGNPSGRTQRRVHQVREWISWRDKFHLTIEKEESVEGAVASNDHKVSLIDGHSHTAYWIRSTDNKCLVDKLNKREPYYLGLDADKHKTNDAIDRLASWGLGVQRQQLFSVSGIEALWLNGLARETQHELTQNKIDTEQNNGDSVTGDSVSWSYEAPMKIVSLSPNGPQRKSHQYGEDNFVRVTLTFSRAAADHGDRDDRDEAAPEAMRLRRVEVAADHVNSSYSLLSYGGFDQLAGEPQSFADTFRLADASKVNINNWLKLCHAPMSAMVYPKLSHRMSDAGVYHLRYYFVVLATTRKTNQRADNSASEKLETQMIEKLFVDEYWSSKHGAQLFVVQSHTSDAFEKVRAGPPVKLLYRDLASGQQYVVVREAVSPSFKCYLFVNADPASSDADDIWTFALAGPAGQPAGQLKGVGAAWLNSENLDKEYKQHEQHQDAGSVPSEWLLKVSGAHELRFVFNEASDHPVNSPLSLMEFSSPTSNYRVKYEMVEPATDWDSFVSTRFDQLRELSKAPDTRGAAPLDEDERKWLHYLLDHSGRPFDESDEPPSDNNNDDNSDGRATDNDDSDQEVSDGGNQGEERWAESTFPDLFSHVVGTQSYQIYSELQLTDKLTVSIDEYVSLKTKVAMYVYSMHGQEQTIVVDGHTGDHFYVAQDLCQPMTGGPKMHPLLKLMPYKLDSQQDGQWFGHGVGGMWTRLSNSQQRDLIRIEGDKREWLVHDDGDHAMKINVVFKKQLLQPAEPEPEVASSDNSPTASDVQVSQKKVAPSTLWYPTSIRLSPANNNSRYVGMAARILRYQPYLDRMDHLQLPNNCKPATHPHQQHATAVMPQLADYLLSWGASYYAKYSVQGHSTFVDGNSADSGDVDGDFYRKQQQFDSGRTSAKHSGQEWHVQSVGEPIDYEEFVSLTRRTSLLKSHVGDRDRVEYFVDGRTDRSYFVQGGQCYQVDKIENFIDEMWFSYEITQTNDTRQRVALMGIGGLWFRANNHNRLNRLRFVPGATGDRSGPHKLASHRGDPRSRQPDVGPAERLHWLSNGELGAYDQWIFDDDAAPERQYSVHLYFEGGAAEPATGPSANNNNLPLRAIKIVKYGEGLNFAKSALVIQVKLFRVGQPEAIAPGDQLWQLPRECAQTNEPTQTDEPAPTTSPHSGPPDSDGPTGQARNMPSFWMFVLSTINASYRLKGEVIELEPDGTGSDGPGPVSRYTVDEFGSLDKNVERIRVDQWTGASSAGQQLTSSFHNLQNSLDSYEVSSVSGCVRLSDRVQSYYKFSQLFVDNFGADELTNASSTPRNEEEPLAKLVAAVLASRPGEGSEAPSYGTFGLGWLWLFAERTSKKTKMDKLANVLEFDAKRSHNWQHFERQQASLLTHQFGYEEWRVVDAKLNIDYSLYFKTAAASGANQRLFGNAAPLAMIKVRRLAALPQATVSVYKSGTHSLTADDMTGRLQLPDGHNCNDLLPETSKLSDNLSQSVLLSKWLIAFQHLAIDLEVAFTQASRGPDGAPSVTSVQSMTLVKMSSNSDWSLRVLNKRDMSERGQLINGTSGLKTLSWQRRYKEIYDYELGRKYQIDLHTGQCLESAVRLNVDPKLLELASSDKQTFVLVGMDTLFGKVKGFKKAAEYYHNEQRMYYSEFELKTTLQYNGQPHQPVVIKRRVAKPLDRHTQELAEAAWNCSSVTIFVYPNAGKPAAHIARVDIKLLDYEILDDLDLIEQMLNIEACHADKSDLVDFELVYPLDRAVMKQLMDTPNYDRLIRNNLYNHLMRDGDTHPMEIMGSHLHLTRSSLVVYITMIDMYKPSQFYTMFRGRTLSPGVANDPDYVQQKEATNLECCSQHCATVKCDAFTYTSSTHKCLLVTNWPIHDASLALGPLLSPDTDDNDDTVAYVLKVKPLSNSIFRFHLTHHWRNLDELIEQLDRSINSAVSSNVQQHNRAEHNREQCKLLTLGLALNEQLPFTQNPNQIPVSVYTKLEPISFRVMERPAQRAAAGCDQQQTANGKQQQQTASDKQQQQQQLDDDDGMMGRQLKLLVILLLFAMLGLLIGCVSRPVWRRIVATNRLFGTR